MDENKSKVLKYLGSNIAFITFLLIGGFLVATWPHLKSLFQTGDYFWIADNDELGLYLPVINYAFNNGLWSLEDPSSFSRQAMGYYPWLQFIPFTLMAKLFGFSQNIFGFMWRIWGAISIPILSYFVLIKIFSSKRIAAAGAALFLFDSGIHYSFYLLKQLKTVFLIFTGSAEHLIGGKPSLFPQWRIITPSISLAFLLLFFLAFYHYKKEKCTKSLVFCCISYGLLFYTYFYFWTGIGLALILSIFLDWKNRISYFVIGAAGFFIGLPDIISKFNFKQNFPVDWQLRTDTFLPIDHFSEYLLPIKAVLVILVSGIFVFKSNKKMIFMWAIAISSIILSNHQVLTGLQIQNFHFGYLRYPACLILFIFIFKELIADKLANLISPYYSLAGLTYLFMTFMFSSALYIRNFEISYSKEPVEKTKIAKQVISNKGQLSFLSNKVITGNENLVFSMVSFIGAKPLMNYLTIFNPSITNDEIDKRSALKYFVSGVASNQIKTRSQEVLLSSAWGPWTRSNEVLAEKVNNQVLAYNNIASSDFNELKKFRLQYYVQAIDELPPSPINAWTLVKSYSFGQVWQIKSI